MVILHYTVTSIKRKCVTRQCLIKGKVQGIKFMQRRKEVVWGNWWPNWSKALCIWKLPGNAKKCPLNANHKKQPEFGRERGPISRRGRKSLSGIAIVCNEFWTLAKKRRELLYLSTFYRLSLPYLPSHLLLLDVYKWENWGLLREIISLAQLVDSRAEIHLWNVPGDWADSTLWHPWPAIWPQGQVMATWSWWPVDLGGRTGTTEH